MFGYQRRSQARAHFPHQTGSCLGPQEDKILIVILDEFVELIEVVRIKMVTLYAKVPFDGFSKELCFVGVGLDDFVSMLQSRIIALTLRLKKVFDFTPRLVGVSL